MSENPQPPRRLTSFLSPSVGAPFDFISRLQCVDLRPQQQLQIKRLDSATPARHSTAQHRLVQLAVCTTSHPCASWAACKDSWCHHRPRSSSPPCCAVTQYARQYRACTPTGCMDDGDGARGKMRDIPLRLGGGSSAGVLDSRQPLVSTGAGLLGCCPNLGSLAVRDRSSAGRESARIGRGLPPRLPSSQC